MTERTRTVTWDDPMQSAQAALQMQGIGFMRSLISGEYPAPPIARLLGFTLLEVEEGRAVFGMQPAEYHYNPIGSVHGGLASILLDSALGVAVHSVLPAGRAYTTVQLNINLVRAMTIETGPVRCEARVLHTGRKVATAEGELRDEAGKLYAHGSTTCIVFAIESSTGNN